MNECQNDHSCGEHAVCENTIGSYTCFCKEGFTGIGSNNGCLG